MVNVLLNRYIPPPGRTTSNCYQNCRDLIPGVGGGVEGRAGEEDRVHRDPLNKPRVP